MNKFELIQELIDQFPYKIVPEFPNYQITDMERKHIRNMRYEILQYNHNIKQKRIYIKNMCENVSYDTLLKWIYKKQKKEKKNYSICSICIKLYNYMIYSFLCKKNRTSVKI